LLVRSDVEGYYVASVPALRGCHTQAKSLDTLMKRVEEAIELCKV
jgi:predicted RNase H-like HicB family nuclease